MQSLNRVNEAFEYNITFVLREKMENNTNEYTTDGVVALMAEFISGNEFQLVIEEVTLQVTEMHESTFYSPMDIYLWCR